MEYIRNTELLLEELGMIGLDHKRENTSETI